MSVMYYWTGTTWELVSTGSGGGGGGVGPPGADGISITVFGPTAIPPTTQRKGDQWLQEPFREGPAMSLVSDMEVVTMSSESLIVRLLPDPPTTVFVTYLP